MIRLKETEAALHRTMQNLTDSNLKLRQEVGVTEQEKRKVAQLTGMVKDRDNKLKVAQLTGMVKDRDNKLKRAWVELDHPASNDGKVYKALSAVLTGMHRDLASSSKRLESSLTAALKAQDLGDAEMMEAGDQQVAAAAAMAVMKTKVAKAVFKSVAQLKDEQSSALKRMLLGVFTSIPCFKQVLKDALPHAEGVMRAALRAEEQGQECCTATCVSGRTVSEGA
jgi:hypothetical protein